MPCAAPEHRLVVVGAGPERDALLATLPGNVRLLSGLTDAQLRWVYAHARVLVAPSFEDYGLTPLEAAVFGRPSLTLRAGGYLDTVREGVTGLYVDAPDPALFRAGLAAADAHPWDPAVLRSHADEFSEAGFAARLHAEVDDLLRPAERPVGRPSGRHGDGRSNRSPSAERPVLDPVCHDPLSGTRVTPDTGSGRLPPDTRGRPSDARHDVAKVP